MNDILVLLEKIDRAKKLDFGTVFSQCIELFKKVWLQGLVTYLLSIVLMIPVMFVIYIPLVFIGVLSTSAFNENVNLDGLGILGIIIILALFLILFVFMVSIALALKAGFYRIIKNKDLGINESDDYFFYFKKKYLKKTMGLGVSIMGMFLLAYVLCVLPVFYIMIPIYYMVVIFAMHPDMSNSDIIKAGFKLGNSKWGMTFGLLFVAAILSFGVGFLMCFVGVYVTQQFIDMPAYQIYKDVIGFEEETEIDLIGTF